MKHLEINLHDGTEIRPLRIYRLRGGYRLLVDSTRKVWQEHSGNYTLLATERNWKIGDDGITRKTVCRAANFFGFGRDGNPV